MHCGSPLPQGRSRRGSRRTLENAIPHQPARQRLFHLLLAKRPWRQRCMWRDQIRRARRRQAFAGQCRDESPELMNVDHSIVAQVRPQPAVQRRRAREKSARARGDRMNIFARKSGRVGLPVTPGDLAANYRHRRVCVHRFPWSAAQQPGRRRLVAARPPEVRIVSMTCSTLRIRLRRYLIGFWLRESPGAQ